MPQLEITSMSSRGQVVIPNDIRKRMNLEEGSKFMIFSDGINLMLKPVITKGAEEFERMAKEMRLYAKRTGLKKDDVKTAIRKVRSRANRP